jgi:hypothetical protein
MNKTEIERYFQEYIFGFIKSDIQREIDLAAKGYSGGNFLAALGLLCYTEFMGEICLQKPNSTPAERFNAFFDYMGIPYGRLREQLEKKGISVYDKFRCGMAHTFFAKDCEIYMVYRGSPETGIIDLSDGKYLFIVQKYFEDFVAAAKRLYDELIAKENIMLPST